jgi:hypothetical protein
MAKPISTNDFNVLKAKGMAGNATTYNSKSAFDLILNRMDLSFTEHQKAGFWNSNSKNFTSDFERLFFSSSGASTSNDATRTVEEFLKKDSPQYKNFRRNAEQFALNNSAIPSTMGSKPPVPPIASTPDGDRPSTAVKDSARPILRPRSVVGGPELVGESMPQQVSDVVQADLFSYQTENEDLGKSNLLHIQNEFNQQRVRFRDPMFSPRKPEGPNVQGYIQPTQWEADRNVKPEFNEMFSAMHGAAKVASLSGVSSLYPDINAVADPYGLPRPASQFVPIAVQPSSWREEEAAAGGAPLKVDSDTWRNPDGHSTVSLSEFSQRDQLTKARLVGPVIY